MNQTKEIEHMLLAGHSITSMEAFKMFGCTRLSAKIFELRKKYPIDMVMIDGTTRYGTPCKYGKYFINKEYLQNLWKSKEHS